MAEEGHGGQQQVVLTLRGSAWHDGLVGDCFVCGLGGLSARQCWAAVMMICCARHWAGWCRLNVWTCMSGLMAVTWCAADGHVMWAVMLMRRAWAEGQGF